MSLDFTQYSTAKNPKYLVIFLHGYGSNKEDLISLAPEFARIIPDALFISPNAPMAIKEGSFTVGYKWFSIDFDPNNRDFQKIPKTTSDELLSASNLLTSFVDELLRQYNLQLKDVFFIGFSQGAMMSVYQGLVSKDKVAGVISYSGRVILPSEFGVTQEVLSKPQICLCHGKEDAVVIFKNLTEAEEKLKKLKIPFESHSFEHLGHNINIEEIKIGKEFIHKLTN